jgi:hypothetical protein
MKPWKVLFAVGCSLIVASCGGGGGTATVNNNTFDIRTAHAKSVVDTKKYAFDFTARIGRSYATGSGTIEQTTLTAATWESSSVLSKKTTISGTGYSGSQQVGVMGTTTSFYDSNYVFVGRRWQDKNYDEVYTLISSRTAIPTSAKIGAAGELYREDIYNLCRHFINGGGMSCQNSPHSWPQPDPLIGSFETTYKVEADTADTAMLTITTTRKGTAGEVISENTSAYRITPSGGPTPIELRTKEGSDESTLTIKN